MRNRIYKYLCIFSLVLILLTFIAGACIVFIRGGIPESPAAAFPSALSAGILAMLAACIAAFPFAKHITRLLFSDVHSRKDRDLSPLLKRLDDQGVRLRRNAAELEEREYGLRTIMENMTEGIVLLSAKGVIISMNRSAKSFLELPDPDAAYIGKHIFAANRNPYLQAAVHDAMGGTSNQEILYMQNVSVEVLANPVWADGEVRAVILLMFDVTEKLAADQMRREFSANVSHELKTPLTSISGYAELLANGLVQPQDVQRFAGNIYNEAQRLIVLVNDIIKLSRLDEGETDIPVENTDLLSIAQDVAARVQSSSKKYGVTVFVTGHTAIVRGSPQILDEMVFNLCDNAIKYNHPGGTVEIHTENTEVGAVLTVSDTGIGIPREHQSRVFERFYRVDKSHSKETGGTGLGLSIVKHGAQFHKAAIELDSVQDRGTAVRLRFPRL